ncbi:MAG: hypothetical protein H0T53_00505 [Herpetosiphonaceae bacterium]|nr:hypothetical protein [Herpetosiphonaceae bacterium]
MKRLICWLTLAGIIMLGSSTNAAINSAPTSAPTPDFWGMVVRDPAYEWGTNPAFPNQANQTFITTMLDNLQAAGVEWVRFEFHGDYTGSDYGSINLAQADYFVQAAHARGLKVLALLGTDILRGPKAAVRNFDKGAVLDPCPPPPIGCGVNEYQQVWLERALAVAAHYQGQIDAYEIFNEPNHYFALSDETNGLEDEMNPYFVAQTITKLFRILRTKEPPEVPDLTPLIVGGLHPLRSVESGRSDAGYITALYTSAPFSGYKAANGRWPVDGVGYHPYPAEMRRPGSDNDFLYRVGPRLDTLVATLRAHDSSAKLWITEAGTRGEPSDPADMERQADFLGQMAAITYARRADVGPWFWFKYEDFPPAAESWGVVRIPFDANGSYEVNGTVALFKPAYAKYQQMVAQYRERVWVPVVVR